MTIRPLLVALLLTTMGGACHSAPAAGQAFEYPRLTGRVVDDAHLLTPVQARRLSNASAAVERKTGAQYVIATVPSLHGKDIVFYGVDLGRHWGIGRKGVNDGLLLIVAPSERKVRIEVGYGLEKRITGPFAARVIRDDILPRFRTGDYAGGIKAASADLIGRLSSKESDRQIAAEDHIL